MFLPPRYLGFWDAQRKRRERAEVISTGQKSGSCDSCHEYLREKGGGHRSLCYPPHSSTSHPFLSIMAEHIPENYMDIL